MGYILQERDFQLLMELASSEFLSFQQVVTYFFNGNSESARKRIAKLIKSEFITMIKVHPTKIKIVRLGKTALGVYRDWWHIKGAAQTFYIKTIRHELAVRSVKLSLIQHFRELPSRFWIEELIIRQDMLRFEIDQQTFRPDAFLRIKQNTVTGWSYFLEIDLGTEPHTCLRAKIKAYERLRKSGEYSRWRCSIRGENRDREFRVIFIVISKMRALNLTKTIMEMNRQNAFLVFNLRL